MFLCAILNAQPMGFYAPAQLVRDARAHGVEVRPVDVNASAWDCTLEPAAGRWLAVREGLRIARGLAERDAGFLVEARRPAGYASVEDVWRRAGISAGALRALAGADIFLSLGLDRRAAPWAIRRLSDQPIDPIRGRRCPRGALVDRLVDLTALLRWVGDRTEGDAASPLPQGRGDEARSGGRDQR